MFDLLHASNKRGHPDHSESHWEHMRHVLRRIVAKDHEAVENAKVFDAVKTFEQSYVNGSTTQLIHVGKEDPFDI